MRKLALILALSFILTSCSRPASDTSVSHTSKIVTGAAPITEAAPAGNASSTTDKASSSKAKTPNPKASSEETANDTAMAAYEAALSEAAASEDTARAASEAAASEAAAKAAAEAAASEAAARAAAEAAASEAAARAAAEAAASEAAARAAAEAAASEANTKKTTAKKVSSKNFLSDVESEVLELQNEERARQGLPPLEYDADLQAAARIRSRELCQAEMFAHSRPDGREWYTVIQEDVPYEYLSAGENLGIAEYNDPSVFLADDPDFWVDGWINSPPHYKNMMRTEYNRVGVGIYKVVRDGMTHAYATTIFARVEE